jgi:predicted Rossmann-fold nucleotide-binding protein
MNETKSNHASVEQDTIDEHCLKSIKHTFRVVIFGSARIRRGDEIWSMIFELAKKIAKDGMDLVTGGGPGLMDAASEGHHAGDPDKKTVQSIGLQIQLPTEQQSAHHLDIKKENHIRAVLYLAITPSQNDPRHTHYLTGRHVARLSALDTEMAVTPPVLRTKRCRLAALCKQFNGSF